MALSTEEMIAFSQNMLTERAAGKVPEIRQDAPATANRPDEGFMNPNEAGLDNVEVSDDYVSQILGFSNLLEAAEPVKKTAPKATMKPEVVQDLTEAQKLQEKISSLVERLTTLLKEAREVMNEMTSTGSIGTGVQTSLGMRRADGEYPPKAKPVKRRRKKA